MFNRGEKVSFKLAGQEFTGTVYGYMARDYDYIQIDLETGERLALNPTLVSRAGQGYQIGQIIKRDRVKAEIVGITEKLLKVKILEVYEKPATGAIRTWKRAELLHATVI